MATVVDLDTDLERRLARKGEPVWDLARLFPAQGDWTEDAYLAIQTNQLIEFSDGCLEVLPVPTPLHQLIAQFLFLVLRDHLLSIGIKKYVFVAPLRLRLWEGKVREPDVLYALPEQVPNLNKPAQGAQLVMEVVSGDEVDRKRDLVDKREDYARAAIPEYWIIDPQEQCIIVLRLVGATYVEHGKFRRGQVATSMLFPTFALKVNDVLDADAA